MSGQQIAEIVESSTGEFLAECVRSAAVPPLGSLVKVPGQVLAFGLVYEVSAGSLEANRRATAFGLTREQLAMEQPQVFELLRTEVRAMLVGHSAEGVLRQILPPTPPEIHSFVFSCSDEEVRAFSTQTDWLRSLFNSARAPVDDLLIAAVRQAALAHPDRRAYLVACGKELAHLLKDDYDRLHSLVRRMSL